MLEKKVESYYESGKELIDELTDEKSERLTPQQKKLFRLELKLIEEEDVANMHTMSNSVNEGEDLDEYIMDEYPLPRHGYHHLLQSFAEDLPKNSIKLNTKVTKISRQNGMVSVHTVDQHGSSSTYECKKVICTISLGLLKEKAIEFDPPLPAPQQHSIDTIGFGILDKVFLAFEKPFWKEDMLRIKIAASEHSFSHFLNFSTNETFVLCGFVSEKFCKDLHKNHSS